MTITKFQYSQPSTLTFSDVKITMQITFDKDSPTLFFNGLQIFAAFPPTTDKKSLNAQNFDSFTKTHFASVEKTGVIFFQKGTVQTRLPSDTPPPPATRTAPPSRNSSFDVLSVTSEEYD